MDILDATVEPGSVSSSYDVVSASPVPLSVTLKSSLMSNTPTLIGNWTTEILGNLSGHNNTDDEKDELVIYSYHHPRYGEMTMILICILLGGMILAIILGNIFVITAILVEKTLQGVSNYLILSLAMTDLLVAVLVMPLSLINEISTNWFLGTVLCDMWISMDVLCCTASILHLVAIAFDRYWAVSNIDYIRSRNARQILFMVAVVWMVSVCISIPPLFGWRHDTDGPEVTGQCLISQDHGYTIFSTVGAFYCPLFLMLIINFKIYRAARYRIRRKRFGNRNCHHNGLQAIHVPISVVNADASQRTNTRHSSGSDVSQDGVSMYMPSCTNANDVTRMDTESPLDLAETNDALLSQDPGIQRMLSNTLTVPACTVNVTLARPGPGGMSSNNNVPKRQRRGVDKERYRREKMEMRRERKAARVLGIITGAFVVCWLPFFIIAVLMPMCGDHCYIPGYVLSLFLWLGYFNSLINPIIYTIFNPSFRVAFRKIFFRRIKTSKRLR
ncbi:5-hydroxytryptamine receptor 1a [Plakobranchus ocellatus]|uniref:5-hydroxytryptamine receptor 1a n=1 Tax=Plakobranchus ocellatus TaxID=259542 RepID=A0AAV4D1I4_9GAST|nr:5-hydroxytryptamine receptor 1a [Plakobranchus ocellatus]